MEYIKYTNLRYPLSKRGPFECECCSRTFTRKFKRDKHLKTCTSLLKYREQRSRSSFDSLLEEIAKLQRFNIQRLEKKLKTRHSSKQYAVNPSSQRRRLTSALRLSVWNLFVGEEDKGRCFCCKDIIFKSNFSCGHVSPSTPNREDTLDHLKPICSRCSSTIGMMDMIHFLK